MTREYKREIYPIELIRTGLLLLDVETINPRKGFYPYRVSRSLVLYHLQPFEDGYLPINREYKPLGISLYNEWVEYESFGFLKIPKQYLDISALHKNLYTFDDSCYPSDKKNKTRYKNIIYSLFKGNIDFSASKGWEQ